MLVLVVCSSRSSSSSTIFSYIHWLWILLLSLLLAIHILLSLCVVGITYSSDHILSHHRYHITAVVRQPYDISITSPQSIDLTKPPHTPKQITKGDQFPLQQTHTSPTHTSPKFPAIQSPSKCVSASSKSGPSANASTTSTA